MSGILRTGKFVRYFAGFTRNIIFNNSIRETEGSLVQKNVQCACISHGFATAAASKPDHNLDRSLRRLDQDVRRTGRISRRDIEEVLEEIRQQRSATSSQSLLVIRCCGNLVPEELPEIRTSLVQEIWKTLNTLNVPMDISHYNALLRVYLENEHPFSPTDFLADLEAKGLEPNRVTYQRLISRYCQQGDIEGATRVLEFMREKGLPVNENVFNALILGHSESNDMESAAGILVVMKQAGLEPSADTYTTLLCCYAKHGKTDEILKIMDECEKKDIFLLDKDILDVVYALTCNGNGAHVDSLLAKIRKIAGYNQDAVNVILRLTNKGYEDVAYKILKTMPRATRQDGELADTGNFFIRQMVKANRPIEKILEICNNMQASGLNEKSLSVATEASLDNGISKVAIPLLKEMKNSGLPIRQHYFWPLICSGQPNEILDILKTMQDDFGVNPSSETVREYVIPNLKENNCEKILALIRSAGISTATSSSATAYTALVKNNIADAAKLMQGYKAFYSPILFKKPLIAALGKTGDFDSYIKIVRQIYENVDRSEAMGSTLNSNEILDEEAAIDETETISKKNKTQFKLNLKPPAVLGEMILDALNYFKTSRVETMEKILQGVVDQGLSIDNGSAQRIQERLGAEMTPLISELLGKLSSGELEPTELLVRRKNGLESMSVEQLEKFIENAEQKKENTNALKRYVLLACIKEKNLSKMEEVLQKLESENYVIGTGLYSQCIDAYINHDRLEDAMAMFMKIKSKESDFILDNYKVVRMCNLFVKLEKLDKALEFLVLNKKEEVKLMDTFNYVTTCWRLLNTVAETANVKGLNELFDVMKENNYIEPNNVLLGPLIKVNLINDDLKSAVDTFETICNSYKATPWKNELACRLIQSEDAANLQRLTDLSTNIHGEVNSLYDLVFSFVECGRIRQARKILETPGLRNRSQRLNFACERYRQEGKIEPLEGLIEATKDIGHIDRNEIYYNLLLSYCKDNNPEKALGLWTKMQEEDITPSDTFLLTLAEFLKKNNLEVPFVIPEITKKREISKRSEERSKEVQEKSGRNQEKPGKEKDKSNVISKVNKSNLSDNIQAYKLAIRGNNPDRALDIKSKLTANETLSVSDQSHLIELFVKSDRLNEATRNVEEMIEQKNFPLPRVFKFYLNKLANTGDLATIERIGNKLSSNTKKLVSFDNRYCHANIIAGKAENYLQKLETDLDKAESAEQLTELGEKFPRGGALGILNSNPQLIDKYKVVAGKYADKNLLGPVNVLWMHNLINGNKSEADEIFTKYFKDSPRLMFQRVLQVARENANENLIADLIKYLKQTKISEGALGNAYSCYLDVLTSQEKLDRGMEVLKQSIDDVCLENINRTALLRLKSAAVAKGLSFPYKIPEKNSKKDFSSSSSSDEERSPSKSKN